MAKRYYSDPRAFALLRKHESTYYAQARSQSAALLIWSLRAIYRLDEVEAKDAVCDQSQDSGVDALVVEDNNQAIILFQAKRKEGLPSTLGDTELKKFVGVLEHFRTEQTVQDLLKSNISQDLRNLLTRTHIARKIAQGYTVRLIFVTNVVADANALTYMQAVETNDTPLELWDLGRFGPVLDQLERDWFVSETARISLPRQKYFVEGTRENPRIVVAAIPARELVRLPGIDDTRIYAQNVRLSLGKTRVNKEIEKSVSEKAEHKEFVTFHNGLTVVAKNLEVSRGKLYMSDYSVCNGCQSLEIFYHNRRLLTDRLEILVRFVRVGDDRRLAESIAYRTNNQNPVSLRDQSSNDSVQVQIKSAFDSLFGEEVIYAIKRGETGSVPELANEDAGRLLLALYARQPWSAHQKHRIFADLYREIFRYGIGAEHIRLSQLIFQKVEEALVELSDQRMRTYGLTSFLLLYLVGEVLREESDGQLLLKSPLDVLSTKDQSRPQSQEEVLRQIGMIANEVALDLDSYVEEKEEADEPDERGDSEGLNLDLGRQRDKLEFDYKSEFKSKSAVGAIRSFVIREYKRGRRRGTRAIFRLPPSL